MISEKVYCHSCKQPTNHKSLHNHKEGSGIDDEYQWKMSYFIAECLGCNHITFVTKYSDEDCINYLDDGSMEWYSEFRVYPEEPKKEESINHNFFNITPKEFLNVPDFIVNLYDQVVAVTNLNYLLLCASGLRTLIEAIYKEINKSEEVSPKKLSLEGKINELIEKGHITKTQADVLHQIRKLGNSAVHEITIPKRRVIRMAIEIIEHVIINIFEYKNYKLIE